jgi:hypothetical protein
VVLVLVLSLGMMVIPGRQTLELEAVVLVVGHLLEQVQGAVLGDMLMLLYLHLALLTPMLLEPLELPVLLEHLEMLVVLVVQDK